MLKRDLAPQEAQLIIDIYCRAVKLVRQSGGQECELTGLVGDLTICHLTCCELDLPLLLDAPVVTFCHDTFGIMRFLDRSAEELTNNFRPRCEKREARAA
jgi:hypothetical protein